MPDPANQETGASSKTTHRARIRWWPVFLILLLAVGATIWVRSSYGRHRQDQNIAIANIAVITFLLLLLWCILLSRLPGKVRWGIVCSVLLLIGLVPLLFRIHGVTGDLIPILEPRWHHQDLASLEAPGKIEAQTAITSTLTNNYPQFLGPNRNGVLDQLHLDPDWKTHPPQRLWQRPVGLGWSGFAVFGNRAITQEQRAEKEAVVCYDLLSGSPIWSYAYAAHFQSSLAGEGPRATPTIFAGKVYAQGSTGLLNCLDLDSGKPIWSKDILRDNSAGMNDWGITCSPLVAGDLVVVSAGGGKKRSLVAYRADNGEFVWGGGTEGAGYSSPFLATLAQVQQILIFNDGGVSAHAILDGKILWKYPWPGGHPHVSIPLVLPGDKVLISSGYGVGSELIQIKKDSADKFSASQLWKSKRLKAKFTNLIYRDGFIYGLDDGIMVCLDAQTGDLKWKEGRYGHGQEILAGDLLLVSGESGEVILLEPKSDKPRELNRFSALNEKTWNPPALAGEYLLVRNDKEAACFRLQLAK